MKFLTGKTKSFYYLPYMKKAPGKFIGQFGLLAGVILSVILSALAQAPTSDLTRDERWRADVRFYASELPKQHKNLFFQLPQVEFERETKTLERRVPKLSDEEVAAELMRISARVGDGHTVSFMPQAAMTFFPFRLERFSEGWFVTQTSDEYKAALGGRLVKIGDRKIERVAASLKRFISADNEIDRESRLRYFFIWSSVLQAEKILKSAESGEFTFQDRDGKSFSIFARPVTAEKFINAPMHNLADDELNAPLTAKNQQANYWFEYLPAHKTLYLAYNKCENAAENPFADLVKEIFDVIDREPTEKFVIDLRRNSGGASSILKSLYAELEKRPRLVEKGRLFVLTSPVTFSSAFMNAFQMRSRYNAIWVGESPGQKPNAYGEVKKFTLPNSKLDVQYSTKFWEEIKGSNLPYLPVDVPVAQAFADYRTGRDAVLQAALDYKAK